MIGPKSMDKAFIKWFQTRVEPYRDVPQEKLTAEREAMQLQQEHNRNYADFLHQAVLPSVEVIVEMLKQQRVVHRVSTWGNQLAIRVHLAWRWGELVIAQTHEDAVSFEHHIITEGEKRTDDRTEDHTHQYDLHDPIPPIIAQHELIFFMTRLAQDLLPEMEPETPPGE